MVKNILLLTVFLFQCLSFSLKAQEILSPGEMVEKAKKYFDGKEYEKAIEILKKAYDQKPAPRILYNIARAYEELGDLKNAILYFDFFAAKAEKEAEKNSALYKIQELREKLRGTLVLDAEAEGAEVYIDGKIIGKTPVNPVKLDPGTHEIVLVHPEYEKQAFQMQILEGKETKKNIKMTKIQAAEKSVNIVPPPVQKQEKIPAESGISIWPWIVLGTGAAAAGTGAVFHLQAFSHYNNAKNADPDKTKNYDSYFDEEYGNAKDDQTVAFILYGAGAAGIIAGIVMMMLDTDEPAATSEIFLLPDFSKGNAVLSGGMRF
jgi:hypothetical protein